MGEKGREKEKKRTVSKYLESVVRLRCSLGCVVCFTLVLSGGGELSKQELRGREHSIDGFKVG